MSTPSWCNEPRLKKPSTKDVGWAPKLSLRERDRRWNELRKKMVLHNLEALVLYGSDAGYGRGLANFRYVTHIADAHGGWAVFTAGGECSVYAAPLHVSLPWSKYLSLQDWVTDFHPNEGVKVVAEALKAKKLGRARIGLVASGATGVSSDTMPHQTYMQLKAQLPDVEFVDATPLLAEMRIRKSEEEIAFLHEAGAIARKKIDAMIRAVRVGNTEADVFAEMVASDIKNGGEPMNFLLLATGNLYDDDPGYKFLLHGHTQPASPTMRKLMDGDLAICEFHSSYGGYMAGVEFSMFLGTPPQELRDIHAACMESVQAAVETMRPGVRMREVWQAIRKPVEDRGFDYVELGFHGHGLVSPEYPLSVYRESDGGIMSGAPIAEFPMEENMVICLNIDVHNPNWRKDVGLMYGDMLHITRDGAKKMVNMPMEFICNEAK